MENMSHTQIFTKSIAVGSGVLVGTGIIAGFAYVASHAYIAIVDKLTKPAVKLPVPPATEKKTA